MALLVLVGLFAGGLVQLAWLGNSFGPMDGQIVSEPLPLDNKPATETGSMIQLPVLLSAEGQYYFSGGSPAVADIWLMQDQPVLLAEKAMVAVAPTSLSQDIQWNMFLAFATVSADHETTGRLAAKTGFRLEVVPPGEAPRSFPVGGNRGVVLSDDISGETSLTELTGQSTGVTGEIDIPLEAEPESAQNLDLIGQLREADLAFNRPSEMNFGDATSVELVLTPQEISKLGELPETASQSLRAEAIGLSKNLAGETTVVESVRYALKTEATLHGLDFKVSPSGPQIRTILPNQAARWVWTVEPLTHGPDRVLTLSISAIVERDGKDLPPVEIETFTERIKVNVSIWDRAVILAGQITTVQGAVAAVGGTGVAVLAWVFARRRKKKTAPQHFVVTHKIEDDD